MADSGVVAIWHDSDVSRVESTLLSVALAGVVTLAAYTEIFLVAAVVLVIQFMIATAPSPADAAGRSVNAPRFGSAAFAGFLATALTIHPPLWLGAAGTTSGSIGTVDSGVFAGMIPAIAGGVSVALLSQMLRRDGRKSLVLTTGYAVTLCSFAALSIGWIGAAESVAGAASVAVGAIALAVSLLFWLIPFDRWIIGMGSLVAGSVAGGVAAELLNHTNTMNWAFGAIFGLGVAMFAILGQVLGRAWCEGRRHASSGWGFPGALSLALAAPIVFVASQLVGASITLS